MSSSVMNGEMGANGKDDLKTPLLQPLDDVAIAVTKEKDGRDKKVKTIRLKIGEIKCDFCAASIESVRGEVNGVERVMLSPLDGHAAISYTSELVTAQKIKETIEDAGFPVDDFPEQEISVCRLRIKGIACTNCCEFVERALLREDPMATVQELHYQSLMPYFDGSNFQYWKVRMEWYLESQLLWVYVIEELVFPTKRDNNGIEVPLPRKEWSKKFKSDYSRSCLCMSIIMGCISREEGNRVIHCSSPYLMWKTLENYHEGTEQVRNEKKYDAIFEYETFKRKPEEDITTMTNRLIGLVTNLRKLGKHYTQEEVNDKILRSLPESWDALMLSLRKNSNLHALRSDELIGELIYWELTLNKRSKDKQSMEGGKKKKTISLKAMEKKHVKEASTSEDDYSDDNEKRIIALLNKRNPEYKRRFKKNPMMELTCYECGNLGHIRSECPKLKRERKGKEKETRRDKKDRKKSFKVTWSDSDASSEEGGREFANLCFFAIEELEDDSSDRCLVSQEESPNEMSSQHSWTKMIKLG